jgi:uridine phosphorylase
MTDTQEQSGAAANSPLLEFDPDPKALIEPAIAAGAGAVPEHGVLCFFQDVIQRAIAAWPTRELGPVKSCMGTHPVHQVQWQGRPLTLAQPGLGAPFAAAFMEELIARGCRRFVCVGACGVLDGKLAHGHICLPTAAVRDEGTSYHYAPPAREIAACPRAVDAVRAVLDEQGIEYTLGKTWTTDAFYRETTARIARRKAEGCVTVEMETAALLAVAQFRGAALAMMLYCGDDVSGRQWDPRDVANVSKCRPNIFDLAADACLRL